MSALTQQSSAVLALVSHLANQSDPVFDLHGQGQYSTTTRGVQKREKMQSDLAQGTSTYYLQMMVQLHKKMFPARPLPKSESELGHLSFLEYLEKTGGYRQNREAAFVMWFVGTCDRRCGCGRLSYVRERLALMAIAMEQSIIDKNDWSVAFLLSLATDPPVSMFQQCSQSIRSTVCKPGSSKLVSSRPQLHQGVRSVGHEEIGCSQSQKEKCSSFRRCCSFAKEKTASVSEKAEGRSSSIAHQKHERIGPSMPDSDACLDSVSTDARSSSQKAHVELFERKDFRCPFGVLR